jgi:hypothetical protein
MNIMVDIKMRKIVNDLFANKIKYYASSVNLLWNQQNDGIDGEFYEK